jgi:hypothetical protein
MIGRGLVMEVDGLFRSDRAFCAFRTTFIERLGTADHELAAHEFFVVEFCDGALGLIHRLHLHEGETLRAHVVAIHNDLDVLNRAHAIEEIEQIALGCIEGEVADVEARGCDFHNLRRSHACGAFGAAGARLCWTIG